MQFNTSNVYYINLAEKFGLVNIDDARTKLNEDDWFKIKEKYKKRDDYKESCVICKEQLGIYQQVFKYFKLI